MNSNFFLNFEHAQMEIRLNVEGHFLMDDEIFTDINHLISKAQELEVDSEPMYKDSVHTVEDAVVALRDQPAILWHDEEESLFLMQIDESNRLSYSKIMPTANGYEEYEKQSGVWQLTRSGSLFVSDMFLELD